MQNKSHLLGLAGDQGLSANGVGEGTIQLYNVWAPENLAHSRRCDRWLELCFYILLLSADLDCK